jgi:hypothetical protein
VSLGIDKYRVSPLQRLERNFWQYRDRSTALQIEIERFGSETPKLCMWNNRRHVAVNKFAHDRDAPWRDMLQCLIMSFVFLMRVHPHDEAESFRGACYRCFGLLLFVLCRRCEIRWR